MNLLHGSDAATTTTGGAKFYKLSYNDGYTEENKVIGWYWGAANGGAFESGANKAWLALSEAQAGARFFGLPEYDESTGIKTLNVERGMLNDNSWYDLSGRKLAGEPVKSGVYVVNGKKVVIK